MIGCQGKVIFYDCTLCMSVWIRIFYSVQNYIKMVIMNEIRLTKITITIIKFKKN